MKRYDKAVEKKNIMAAGTSWLAFLITPAFFGKYKLWNYYWIYMATILGMVTIELIFSFEIPRAVYIGLNGGIAAMAFSLLILYSSHRIARLKSESSSDQAVMNDLQDKAKPCWKSAVLATLMFVVLLFAVVFIHDFFTYSDGYSSY